MPDRELREILKRARSKMIKSSVEGKQFDAEFEKHTQAIVQKELTGSKQLGMFPTYLGITQIFKPLPRRGRRKLQAKAQTFLIGEQTKSWEKVEYNGELLSVDDQDIFCCLLFLSEGRREFLTTYTKIQEVLRMKSHPKNNQRIKESLQRLEIASFIVEFKVEGESWGILHILRSSGFKNKIKVEFDKIFYDRFLDEYTIYSLPFRFSIKGDIAKLLFMFLNSHTTPKRYHLETLIDQLNLNKKLQRKYLLRQLKEAFRELEQKGFIKDFQYDSKRELFSFNILKKKHRLKLI